MNSTVEVVLYSFGASPEIRIEQSLRIFSQSPPEAQCSRAEPLSCCYDSERRGAPFISYPSIEKTYVLGPADAFRPEHGQTFCCASLQSVLAHYSHAPVE